MTSRRPGRVWVGTSGWRYRGWRGDFYPSGLVQREELRYLAERLTSVEINGSFYSLQRADSFRTWAEQTPDGFVFAVKGSRYITHLLRLADAETALANFFASGVLTLGGKLGPILWQLPARLAFDAERLDAFFGLLPRTTAQAARLAAGHDERVPDDRAVTVAPVDRPIRYALEPRHPGFAEPAAVALLRRHGVALVLADSAGTWPTFESVTSDLVYVRLHGESDPVLRRVRPRLPRPLGRPGRALVCRR